MNSASLSYFLCTEGAKNASFIILIKIIPKKIQLFRCSRERNSRSTDQKCNFFISYNHSRCKILSHTIFWIYQTIPLKSNYDQTLFLLEIHFPMEVPVLPIQMERNCDYPDLLEPRYVILINYNLKNSSMLLSAKPLH